MTNLEMELKRYPLGLHEKFRQMPISLVLADDHFARDETFAWWYNIDPEQAWFKGVWYERAKRAVDISIVLMVMPLLLLLLLLCILLIKIESPGSPVFFYQERTGKDGNRFKMLKFRTMVNDAESLKKDLMHLNELAWPDFKITNDPRLTKVGYFLRRTSLDELPQLINILRGEMSLVGPRPTSFGSETYELWQSERLDVLPGLTGLWQVIGRGSMEFDERVQLDIAYIERRCLWLDWLILFHTVTAVIHQRGAY